MVDSSVIVKWLNKENEERLDNADRLLKDVQKGKINLCTPDLAKYEVSNALLIKKHLTVTESKIVLGYLFALPIELVALNKDLAKETYKIADDLKITFYDACFIALAKRERATLVTDNPKHQAKTKEITVISLEEYGK